MAAGVRGDQRHRPVQVRGCLHLKSAVTCVADETLLQSSGVAVEPFLSLPLTNLESERRCSDPAQLEGVLSAAALPQSLFSLVSALKRRGLGEQPARATVAWLLKYGVLRPV